MDYYEHFITTPDRETDALALAIMRDTNILQRFGHTSDIFDQVKTVLKLMALGVMALNHDFKLIFLMPVGPLPDEPTLSRIDDRISRAELSMRAVLKRVAAHASKSN